MGIDTRPQKVMNQNQFDHSKKKYSEYYGAIDLGTNNCRLLIAQPKNSGHQIVASYSQIVRLGEDLTANDYLSEGAMTRTINALSVCAHKLRNYNVNILRNVATEACRKANNCDAFFDRIQTETGLIFETISSEEEARLAMLGCQNLLTENYPFTLAFDIGGGSTEVIWSEQGNGGIYRIVDVLSLPFGVLTLSENYDAQGKFADFYERVVLQTMEYLKQFSKKNKIEENITSGNVQMLGIAGTVTTLSALHLKLPYYMRSEIDGLEIGFEELSGVSKLLFGLEYKARARLPCIGKERAKLVLPGCAILEAICKSWPIGHLRIADRGLREGILTELIFSSGFPIIENKETYM